MFVLRMDPTAKYVPRLHIYIATTAMASDRTNTVHNVKRLGSIMPRHVHISITITTQNNWNLYITYINFNCISEGNFDEHDLTDFGDDDSDAPSSCNQHQKCEIDLILSHWSQNKHSMWSVLSRSADGDDSEAWMWGSAWPRSEAWMWSI